MSQESVQDFVKIPGVLGVALIPKHAQSYFYLKEQILNNKDKQVLALKILHLVASPEEVEPLTLQYSGYYLYVYRLNYDICFLTITDTDISAIKLRPLAAKQLKYTLQRDTKKALRIFELLASSPQPQLTITANVEIAPIKNSSSKALELDVTIEQLLNALNHLSQFSSSYIGTKLTANYWQLTRPDSQWLDNFRINRSAELVFSGAATECVSSLEHQLVKEWAAAFITHCSQIILNLPVMIEQRGLSEVEQSILLTP